MGRHKRHLLPSLRSSDHQEGRNVVCVDKYIQNHAGGIKSEVGETSRMYSSSLGSRSATLYRRRFQPHLRSRNVRGLKHSAELPGDSIPGKHVMYSSSSSGTVVLLFAAIRCVFVRRQHRTNWCRLWSIRKSGQVFARSGVGMAPCPLCRSLLAVQPDDITDSRCFKCLRDRRFPGLRCSRTRRSDRVQSRRGA